MSAGDILSNGWVQNLVCEVVGVGLGVTTGYFLGRKQEAKRLVRQFYDGVEPVLGKIAELRASGKLASKDASLLVQTISLSFQKSFVGDSALVTIKKDRMHQPGTEMTCGICDENVKLVNDLCPLCNLDCCAWDTLGSVIRSQELPAQLKSAEVSNR